VKSDELSSSFLVTAKKAVLLSSSDVERSLFNASSRLFI